LYRSGNFGPNLYGDPIMADHSESDNSLPTPHDVFFKANLAEKSKAKALLKQIYSTELVSKLDLKNLKQVPTEFMDKF
jgi:hypothetical protein